MNDIRLDDHGRVDDIVATGQITMVHVERMDDGYWWMRVYHADGTPDLILHINAYPREHIEVTAEEE